MMAEGSKRAKVGMQVSQYLSLELTELHSRYGLLDKASHKTNLDARSEEIDSTSEGRCCKNILWQYLISTSI